jgi:peptidoglycan/xylan/chitin deacetylase (PgdA/CDA1 family)
MFSSSFLSAAALVVVTVSAFPFSLVENPLEIIRRAPPPGVILNKCAKPGVFALAFDDGPFMFTQKLVDILNTAGAKGTFFFTGTLYGECFVARFRMRRSDNNLVAQDASIVMQML